MNVRDLRAWLAHYHDESPVYVGDRPVVSTRSAPASPRVELVTGGPRALGQLGDAPVPKLYVALVDRNRRTPSDNIIHSNTDRGAWQSFMGHNHDAVIEAAVRARDSWGRGRYRVLTGALDGMVAEPVPTWTIEPIT